MQTLVESRQTYQFRLETKEGATPRVVYDYPIYVRTQPDWQEFRQKLAALHADHITLVVDAGLPEARVATELARNVVSTLRGDTLIGAILPSFPPMAPP